MSGKKLGKKGPGFKFAMQPPQPVDIKDIVPEGVDTVAQMIIGSESFECNVDDLENDGDYAELGRGQYGSVYRMRHKPTNTIMAVKRIRATIDKNARKSLLMDLKVCMKATGCPYTITFYGALFREGDVMICMELMDKSLHALYRVVYEQLKQSIPLPVLGKMAESTLKALFYLKTELNVLHRDVKPSNILINKKGEIKLCDFGIAGELVNSFLATDIGCKPYLAPERINPIKTGAKYDQRSDVWSYGITMSEMALGRFPYPEWKTVFDQLKSVVEGDPPKLPDDDPRFSDSFKDLIHKCLTKDVEKRPRFYELIEHPYIKEVEQSSVDVAAWYGDIVKQELELKQARGK